MINLNTFENYSGTNFTDDLNDGKEFLYTTIRYKDNKEVIFVNMLLKNLNLLDMVKEKVVWKKYTEAIYKYRTNTGKMTASDYTHLFGYLNPYYRSAYNIPKRRK